MKILVTGAKGFVGKNLCAQLKNIKEGKARNYGISVEAVYEYDLDSTPEELDAWCAEADFVFNLAGVNRPQNQEEFMQGNFGFASTLLDTLKKHGNKCPVMLSSSQQASLTGRFGNSEYGRSKKAGEDLFLDYQKETGAKVLVYRFPNLFGKWCRPNYNSAVATFCNAFANDLPYTVNDPSVELELLYIDDLVDEMIACLKGEEHRCEFDGLEVIPTPKDNANTNLPNDTNDNNSVDSSNLCSEKKVADVKRLGKSGFPRRIGDRRQLNRPLLGLLSGLRDSRYGRLGGAVQYRVGSEKRGGGAHAEEDPAQDQGEKPDQAFLFFRLFSFRFLAESILSVFVVGFVHRRTPTRI